jgi:hypothetical protein
MQKPSTAEFIILGDFNHVVDTICDKNSIGKQETKEKYQSKKTDLYS